MVRKGNSRKLLSTEREALILRCMAEGVKTVGGLVEELNVSEATVRRDLENLEQQGLLRRVHGGAELVKNPKTEPVFAEKTGLHASEKTRIAHLAEQCINDGDTIFLDASTTTFFMAKELKNHRNVTVITNSLRVVAELSGCEHVKVISVGGVLSNNQSFVGTLAEKAIEENYVASKIFFSSKGIAADAGILESNEAECGIKHKMIANAKEKYYLCDKSKMGGVGFVKLIPMAEIDYNKR